MEKDWKSYRDKIIGLGEFSLHKSYYPELQDNIDILEASQKNLQFLIDSISDAIIIHDFTGKILYVNKQALIIFNLSETEYSTFTISEITSPKQDTSSLNSIWKDLSIIGGRVFEWIGIQQKTNVDLPLQVSLSPTQWYSKPAIVAVIRDFTERKKFEQEIITAKEKSEKSENLYRKMNENSPLGMHFYRLENNQLVFTAANPAASILLKVDNSQFIGKTIEEAFPTLAQTEVPYRYRNAAENGISWITEQINYDDKRIVGAYEVRAFQTTPGNMVAIFTDITERKCIEIELIAAKEKAEESERNIKTIFNTSKNMMMLLNKYYCIVDANNAALKKADCSHDEMINTSVFNFLSPKLFEETKRWLDTSWGASKIEDLETITFDRFGNKFIVEISASKIDYDNTEVMLLNMNDISQRKELEQELLKSVINTEEKERLLFSQELHDGLGPVISAIKMYTDWLSGSEGIPPEILPEIFSDIHQLVSEASETIREISFKLSPHILQNYGLLEALEAYIEKVKLSPKINFITKFDHLERFNETNETIAYRVICECINNGIKHAAASEIVLKIIKSDDVLLINYSDNGKGFNVNEVLKKHKGTGLLNMQSRIKSISGNISYSSVPPHGTAIFIKIPME